MLTPTLITLTHFFENMVGPWIQIKNLHSEQAVLASLEVVFPVHSSHSAIPSDGLMELISQG